MGFKSIKNRKAFHDYIILSKLEAGIELKGSEVKSIRAGQVNLQGAYVKVTQEEASILGMHINPYEQSFIDRPDPVRERRLLLHKREITKLYNTIILKSLTVIPISLYFKRGFVKLEIALAKGKKLYDKRDALKKKTAQREINSSKY